MTDHEMQEQRRADGLSCSNSERQLLHRLFGQSVISLGLSDLEPEHTLSPTASLLLNARENLPATPSFEQKYVFFNLLLFVQSDHLCCRERFYLPRIGPFDYGPQGLLVDEPAGQEANAPGTDPFAGSNALILELLELLERGAISSPKSDLRPAIPSPSSSSIYCSISGLTVSTTGGTDQTTDTSPLSPWSPKASHLRHFSQSYEDLIDDYPADVSCESSSCLEKSSTVTCGSTDVTRRGNHRLRALSSDSLEHSPSTTTDRIAHGGTSLIPSGNSTPSLHTRRRLQKNPSRKIKVSLSRIFKIRGKSSH